MADNIRKAKIWLETVKSLIDTAINKAQFNKKKKAVIQSLNDDGTANILMNNELFEHVEIRAGLLPEIGEVVRIEIPNGDTKDMYVDTSVFLGDIDAGIFTPIPINGGLFTETAVELIDGGLFTDSNNAYSYDGGIFKSITHH